MCLYILNNVKVTNKQRNSDQFIKEELFYG